MNKHRFGVATWHVAFTFLLDYPSQWNYSTCAKLIQHPLKKHKQKYYIRPDSKVMSSNSYYAIQFT